MASSISVIAALSLLAIGARCQCLVGNDNPVMMDQNTQDVLRNARFDFAIESLKKISEIESQDNVFFSPHSLYEALLLAFFGARGETEAALRRALHVPDNYTKADVQRFYGYERSYEAERKMNSSSNYEFEVANRLWLGSSKRLRDCMLDFFGDELERVDFKADPEAARLRINQWVSNVTRNNIRDLLPKNVIDASTDAVLANAVYFKGLWQSKFLPENTKKAVFYLPHFDFLKPYPVTQFMRQKGSFNHMVSEDLGVHILQLPYKGNDLSMYILLPPYVSMKQGQAEGPVKSDGVRQLLQRLSSSHGAAELREIMDHGMITYDVAVTIPKFALERELPVKDLLSAMGAGVVFDTVSADFGGFTADGEPGVQLGDAVHRAKIEVAEEGTTAAAATAIFSFRSSRPNEPAVFTADHPFAYFVYDQAKRSVLFAGIFRNPNKQ